MAENEFYKIDKLLPYKAKPKGHIQIKDGDLQINVPHAKDMGPLSTSSVSFKKILSDYMNEVGHIRSEPITEKITDHDEIQKAMDDAASSFESMMQIRKELEDAYKELMQMQV